MSYIHPPNSTFSEHVQVNWTVSEEGKDPLFYAEQPKLKEQKGVIMTEFPKCQKCSGLCTTPEGHPKGAPITCYSCYRLENCKPNEMTDKELLKSLKDPYLNFGKFNHISRQCLIRLMEINICNE